MSEQERGQQCPHGLTSVGRHRLCRTCGDVYMAVAGPNEVVLLGRYAAVMALFHEWEQAIGRVAATDGDGEGER